jgi:hypothetical protein
MLAFFMTVLHSCLDRRLSIAEKGALITLTVDTSTGVLLTDVGRSALPNIPVWGSERIMAEPLKRNKVSLRERLSRLKNLVLGGAHWRLAGAV